MTTGIKGMGAGVSDSAKLYLLHPVTGEFIRSRKSKNNMCWIELYSSDSRTARQAAMKIVNNRLEKQRKGESTTAEEAYDRNLDQLAACTKDWNLINLQGDPVDLECTQENARELYREFNWILEQTDEFVSRRANFFEGSSTS